MNLPSALLAALLAAPGADDCDARLQRKLSTDLALDYQAFDQTPDSGFRTLAADCPRQAADLVEAWIAANGEPSHSLRWHIAQLRAEAGQTEAAIVEARASLRANEDPDPDFRWNDYVSAIIAFLENDRAGFDSHRDRVADATDRHAGNAMNLTLLDRLGRGFGKPYREALQAAE